MQTLFTDLAEGRGDIALGNLTITPERQKSSSAFSTPLFKNAAGSPAHPRWYRPPEISSPDALVGYGNPCSIHLPVITPAFLALNKTLEAAGKDPVRIVEADENLEDEDLIELVNAGALCQCHHY